MTTFQITHVRYSFVVFESGRTVRTFNTTELSADMKKAIADQFELIFGDPEHTKAFAVRSSAVGTYLTGFCNDGK